MRAHDWDEAAAFARWRWTETGWRPPADASSVDDLLGPAPIGRDLRAFELVDQVHAATLEVAVEFDLEW